MPSVTLSFIVSPLNRTPRTIAYSADEIQDDEEQGLVLGGLDAHLNELKSKYPTGEMDFLALARKRAEEKTESHTAGAKDEDWKMLADEKEEMYGRIDDWENSQREAGNADSQILMFTEPTNDDESGDGEGDDEPKLLLF